jgi:cytochrome c553
MRNGLVGALPPIRDTLAAAGADQRVLRAIARNLPFLAQQPEMAALPAIRELADRLDGKPKQEAEVTLRQAIARELTDDDLAAIAVAGEDEEIEQDSNREPSKLN